MVTDTRSGYTQQAQANEVTACTICCAICDLPLGRAIVRMQTYCNCFAVEDCLEYGTLFSQLYQPMPQEEMQTGNKNTQKLLSEQLYALGVAAVDLNLYLDMHPGDERAAKHYAQLYEQIQSAKREYEQKYGALINFANSLCESRMCWVDRWPWQSGGADDVEL